MVVQPEDPYVILYDVLKDDEGAFIVPCESGTIYTNRVAGSFCDQLDVEGLAIVFKVPDDIRAVVYDCLNGITDDQKDRLNELFFEHKLPFHVNSDMLYESREACLWVVMGEAVPGVLTWLNSDGE